MPPKMTSAQGCGVRAMRGPARKGFASGGATDQLLHARAPGHHGQVGRQAALALEMPQHRVVLVYDFQQDLSGDVFGVFGLQVVATEMGGVLDDVVDQAQKAIHEIVPSARFVMR